MIRLRLPTPPSVNALYYNCCGKGKRGRGKTKRYRDWIKEADSWFLMQKRELGQVRGPCDVMIMFPKTRKDLSNMIKALEDYLVSREITGDDKNNHSITVKRDVSLTCCEIFIKPQNGS